MKLGIFAVFVVVVKKFLSLPGSNSCSMETGSLVRELPE